MSASETKLRQLVLAAPESAEGLFQLLVEGLDWPAPPDITWDNVEIEWQPEDVHLDPRKLANLHRISQIPKFTQAQAFGVFVLEFEGGRLPIGAIRRLVDKLVVQKRARAGRGSNPIWKLDDLLFFCLSSDENRAVHVVGLREQEGKRVLRVLSWKHSMTDARLDLLMKRGMPGLRWDHDGPSLAHERKSPQGFVGYRQSIRSAAALSRRMAEVAQDVRDEVAALYEVETDDGPIRSLFREVRDQLLTDLTPARFSDVYAQTMVYGLLTARIAHPEDFTADRSVMDLHFENPFLDAIYSRFRTQSADEIDVDELGLRELAEELAGTDLDDLLVDFGASDQRDDPVVYFYEEFLAQYDPKQRKDLGAFYTPLPVVRFMVRAVDSALKQSAGLSGGLADRTTWAEYESAHGVPTPKYAGPSDPVVSVVDPANGTGTFMVQWLRAAREAGEPAEATLEKFTAFEVSLASYAVAQLKIQMELGAKNAPIPVFLSDTLQGPSDQMLEVFDDPVSTQGVAASARKFESNHTVVIGNPPYDRDESQASSGARRKGGMIRYFEHTTEYGLIRDFINPLKRAGKGVYAKSLYNDYVYFWRWALWKACEQNTGPAVVSLISPSSFLAGPAFAGMREFMRQSFDEIWLLDLGGEGRGVHREENVFEGVLTPVVICVGVRSGGLAQPATVRYRRIQGSRSQKFAALERLEGLTAIDSGWEPVEGVDGAPFLPSETGGYHQMPLLTDLFPWRETGLHFYRSWPIAESATVLETRWSTLMSTPKGKRADLLKESRDRKAGKPYRDVFTGRSLPAISSLPSSAAAPRVQRYGYRSFDRQWCLPDGRVGDYLRPQLWRCASEKQVFFQTLAMSPLGAGPALMAFADVPDCHAFRGRGDKGVMPLWTDPSATAPNINEGLVRILNETFGLKVTAEDLAAYVYALLGTGAYTATFAKEVAVLTTGPRVPVTKDPRLFSEVSQFGRELLWWHTFGQRFGSGEIPASAKVVSPITGCPGKYAHDAARNELVVGDGRLGPVSAEVFGFEVSGFKVLQSWLGNRMASGKGRKSSPLDDIRHDQWTFTDELVRVISILQHTVDVTPRAQDLLDRVTRGDMIMASELPPPTVLEMKGPG